MKKNNLDSIKWDFLHTQSTTEYTRKIEIQNHKKEQSNERKSCIGITLEIENGQYFEKVVIMQDIEKTLGAGYSEENKYLTIIYDKADINNIVNFLSLKLPISITYGEYTNEDDTVINYAAIEINDLK